MAHEVPVSYYPGGQGHVLFVKVLPAMQAVQDVDDPVHLEQG